MKVTVDVDDLEIALNLIQRHTGQVQVMRLRAAIRAAREG